MIKDLNKKKVTVLGFSISGIASAKYLVKKCSECTISEKREAKPEDLETIEELKKLNIKIEMGEHKKETVLNSDLIIASPGIPPRAEVLQLAKDNNIEVINDVELAFRESTKPFIAITGTNGKTTTTKLTAEILENAGCNAPKCGNFGVSPMTYIEYDPDYFVAEVSSFQIYSSPTFKPLIGIFLNYTPDHIDWHGSKEEYLRVKKSLFEGDRAPEWAILNGNDKEVIKLNNNYPNKTVLFGVNIDGNCIYVENDSIILKLNGIKEKIISLDQISLIGNHNLENVMSAIAAASILKVDKQTIIDTIINFQPPEHRLEYFATINGSKFYNDSKATNCDSTINALKAFKDPSLTLIAGGRDKGTDLTELVDTIKKHASNTILIGEAKDRFKQELEKGGYNKIIMANTLEEAVDISLTLKTNAVLFAPACSSFDMYKNYEERGKIFKNYVKSKN